MAKSSPCPVEASHVIGGGSLTTCVHQWHSQRRPVFPAIAVPSEATAIGNVMVHALAAGAAKTLLP